MLWARTNERRASSELVMPGRRSSTVSAVYWAVVIPAAAHAPSMYGRSASSSCLMTYVKLLCSIPPLCRRPFRVTSAGGSEGDDGMLGRGRTEIRAIAFEAALQLGHIDGASWHVAGEREVGGGSRGLAHHEAGAGHASG